ncbi:NUDIX hydrolase [Patescibacteria group bacterium]|nr:NUDIX hydrolase [Patescibacteria group bacterium]
MSIDELIKDLEKKSELEGIKKRAIGTIITNSAREVLVVQRTSYDSYPNLIELPGGGVEDGETIVDTIKREAKEEVGFVVSKIVLYLGCFDYEGDCRETKRQFNFLVEGEYFDNKITLSEEHTNYFWVNKQNFEKFNISEEVKKTLRIFFNLSY